MNKPLYRVIFSKVSRTFIAVAETTAAQGKRKGSSASAKHTFPLMRFATLSVVVASLFSPVTVVNAQMVAYKNGAAPRPIMDQSANGRPIVQIVNPNATGLSHNKYDQFNVDSNGVILNNSPTNVSTQLGGYIQGNPQINRPANIILNEVMSTNRSQLNGYIEVAGQRAEVIVANPNGISIGNGAGFINTTRGVLTTGTPVFGGDGSLAAFRVTKGDITIGSGGMNGLQTDQLDLIARSVQVNDAIWANGLNVIAGANQVNYANLGVQVIAGEGNQPTVGIDSSALGGMYAQKIMLVGTEAGVGVRTLGTISASAGDITINSHGQISLNGQTNAAGQIKLQSDDDISNTGTLYGQQSVLIASRGQLTNSGTIAALHDLTVNANRIDSSGVFASGINSAGQVTEPGNLTLTSPGLITTTGQNVSGGDITMTGSGIAFTDGTTSANTSANGAVTLTATAGDINHQGATLVAAGSTTLSATGNIINDAGVIKANALSIHSDAFSNIAGSLIQSGTESGTGNTQITTTNVFNNTDGIIASDNDLHLQAASLIGNGSIITGRDATFQLQSDYTFTDQTIFRTNRDFTFSTTGAITNTTDLESVRNLTLSAENITNTGDGLINAGNGLTLLNAAQTLYNIGRIYGDDIAIQANNITNDGVVDANGNTLQAGIIAARNDLDLGAHTIINREHAVLQSLRNMRIGAALDANHRATGKATYLQNASATIDAGADLNLQVAQLDNLNNHFVTELQRDDNLTRRVLYYMLNGSDVKYYSGVDVEIRNVNDIDKLFIKANGTYHNDYTVFNYLETTDRTVVVRSDPGSILAGGQMVLSGQVNNNKSKIIAGGAMTGELSGLTNTDATGEVIVTRGGDGNDRNGHPLSYSQYHTTDKDFFGNRDDDYHDPVKFYALIPTTSSLNIVQQTENQHPDHVDNDAVGVGVDHSDMPTGDAGAPVTLPNSQLFPITTDPTANYLIETDPKFTNYKTFLSSDYMLSRLSVNPQLAQKRLGDGFYEQKLINDQIAELTGKRFLGDYTTNEQQYQALMESGIKVAEQFQLTPGIALTASQMASLTSDMVWLVSKDITLPDGTKTKALVPVVYLARVDSTQVQPTGAIISARHVDLAVSGTVQNGGTLQATNNALIHATDIINTGTLKTDAAKGNTVLIADNDIINTGGNIAGKSVGLLAGRDVIMSTTVSENKTSHGNAEHGFSSENNVIDKVVRVTADQLSIQSGRDISLTATQVTTTGDANMVAGRDINLGTVTTKEAFSANYDAKNNLSASQTNAIGTQITTGGNLVLSAAQDINAKAAYVNATGEITAAAGRDINLTSAQQERHYAQETYVESSGILSSSSAHTKSQQHSTQSIGTTFSGDKIHVAAGNNINVTGSNIVGTNDVNVVAGNNINITASQDTARQRYSKEETTSGLFTSGGFGITLGSKEEGNTAVTKQVINNASTIGSTNGNVTLVAGNGYTQSGSNLVAVAGDTTISAKSVDITAVQDSYSQTNTTHTEQSGLTLAVSAPIITAVQTVQKMRSAASQTDDKRMQVLAGATAASAAYSGVSAAQNPSAGVTVSLTIGSSESESQSTQTSNSVVGSKVTAGGNVSIRATGAGENSNLNIIGSDITAGQNAILKADGDINLLAAQGSSGQQSSSSSSSAAVGIAATYGADGFAFGITANAAGSRGNADGSDVTYANTHINAGNGLVLESGQDTNLMGAVASAQQVLANVGTSGSGNLNIQSLQDTSKYNSEDQSIGGSITVGYGAAGSFNYGKNQANSDYASVGEQSGIKAGDGGFIVNVNGNTNLTGGIISSTATPDKNVLVTKTLTQSDIQNHANASADSFGIGLSSDMLTQGTYGAGKAIAAGLLSNSDESGSSAGTTRSAVSSGTVIISDSKKQQELTGLNVDATVASLNRDTENAHTAAQKQDVLAMEQTVKANQAIKQAAIVEATKFTDEAYRTAFLKQVDIYVVKKDENGNPYPHKLSETEKQNLQAGKGGKVHIADNGIFNAPEEAAKYASQHSSVEDGPQYLIHYPEATNGISELLVSGYQYFLENDALGLSNATQATKDMMNEYGKDGLHLDGHSRGSMTVGNALESIQNQPDSQGTLNGTTINFFGPAYNAQKADAILGDLQNRDALTSTEDKNNSVLKFMNHSTDWIGGWVGGNPNTGGTIPEGSNFVGEALRIIGDEFTVHNCYGAGAKECGAYWQGSPKNQPSLQPVRKY